MYVLLELNLADFVLFWSICHLSCYNVTTVFVHILEHVTSTQFCDVRRMKIVNVRGAQVRGTTARRRRRHYRRAEQEKRGARKSKSIPSCHSIDQSTWLWCFVDLCFVRLCVLKATDSTLIIIRRFRVATKITTALLSPDPALPRALCSVLWLVTSTCTFFITHQAVAIKCSRITLVILSDPLVCFVCFLWYSLVAGPEILFFYLSCGQYLSNCSAFYWHLA